MDKEKKQEGLDMRNSELVEYIKAKGLEMRNHLEQAKTEHPEKYNYNNRYERMLREPLTRRKTSVGAQGFQTPSYSLSPLDFGPKISLGCLFLFLLSFLSGHPENTAGNGGVFY